MIGRHALGTCPGYPPRRQAGYGRVHADTQYLPTPPTGSYGVPATHPSDRSKTGSRLPTPPTGAWRGPGYPPRRQSMTVSMQIPSTYPPLRPGQDGVPATHPADRGMTWSRLPTPPTGYGRVPDTQYLFTPPTGSYGVWVTHPADRLWPRPSYPVGTYPSLRPGHDGVPATHPADRSMTRSRLPALPTGAWRGPGYPLRRPGHDGVPATRPADRGMTGSRLPALPTVAWWGPGYPPCRPGHGRGPAAHQMDALRVLAYNVKVKTKANARNNGPWNLLEHKHRFWESKSVRNWEPTKITLIAKKYDF